MLKIMDSGFEDSEVCDALIGSIPNVDPIASRDERWIERENRRVAAFGRRVARKVVRKEALLRRSLTGGEIEGIEERYGYRISLRTLMRLMDL